MCANKVQDHAGEILSIIVNNAGIYISVWPHYSLRAAIALVMLSGSMRVYVYATSRCMSMGWTTSMQQCGSSTSYLEVDRFAARFACNSSHACSGLRTLVRIASKTENTRCVLCIRRTRIQIMTIGSTPEHAMQILFHNVE